MTRWLRHQRFWKALIGTTTAFGLAFGNGGMEALAGPAKVGDVISLKFRDAPDRQFKVLNIEKQGDGTYHYELKDTKTGEIITLVDQGGDIPVTEPTQQKTQEPVVPKLNLDPLPDRVPLPPVIPADTPPVKNPAGKADSKQTTSKTDSKQTPTAGMAPMPDPPQDPAKRPNLLSRIFGPKKTPPAAGTSTPNANTSNPNTPSAANPNSSATMPPPVRPTPGLFPPPSGVSAEPPRVLPIQPVAPPAPMLFQNSSPPPLAKPPLLLPTPPAPMTPGIPSIPIPPGGMSSNSPTIIQTRYLTPDSAAMVQEIQPYVVTLRTAMASSQRIYALQALAGCRHASSDTVKKVLFDASKSDPCPLVRACCIDELCKLGYYNTSFLAYLKVAYEDPSDVVHESAKEALRKMAPKK